MGNAAWWPFCSNAASPKELDAEAWEAARTSGCLLGSRVLEERIRSIAKRTSSQEWDVPGARPDSCDVMGMV